MKKGRPVKEEGLAIGTYWVRGKTGLGGGVKWGGQEEGLGFEAEEAIKL